jgi:hypothetical protein
VNIGPAADLVRVDESETGDLAHEDADDADARYIRGQTRSNYSAILYLRFLNSPKGTGIIIPYNPKK